MNVTWRIIKAMARAMKDAFSDDVSPWIGVDERLPEEDVTVLACSPHGVGVCRVWHDMGTVRWRFANHPTNLPGVTHWMPLPEPPKP